MARKSKYQTEQTSIGVQFLIPGTERIRPRMPPTYTSDDAQLVIPGGERITTGELITRKMSQPIKPRVSQKSICGTALFGFTAR